MGFPNMSSEPGGVEIVAGNIAADGTVTNGKGFSAAAIAGTSMYTITLDREYNGLIAAVATPFHTGGDVIAVVDAVSAFPADAPGTTIAFGIYDGDGTTAQACPFYFVLVLDKGDA